MPESINDISNDMEQLRKTTEETAQQMAELQARIEAVIRALAEARGKTVSPESVTRAAQRVTGEETVPGRVTVSPGQRMRTGAIGEELRALQAQTKALQEVNRVSQESARISQQSATADSEEVVTIRDVIDALRREQEALQKASAAQKDFNQATAQGVTDAQKLVDAVGNAGVADYKKQQAVPPAEPNAPKTPPEEETVKFKETNEERRRGNELGKEGLANWKKEVAEAERLAKIEEQITAQRLARPKVFAEAEKRGFTPGKPGFQVQATEEASSGISRTTFAYRDMDGTLKRLSVTQDKFGNVLVDTQRRFRTLGDAIVKDTVEVFKWTVAVALIYAPLQKLQELTTLMIKNEAELANITVILGKSQADLVNVFNAAAQAAKATGESIDGVLEGYTLAYRATGVYTDSVQRAAVAQKLLVDSLTLAKLAGASFAAGANDQAEALDTLVAALRQMGMGLDQGSVLLNKWVAVTKAANVDLKTLSESFAITATSAESAGLSIDELNGIIATISEATSLSATEAGNAVRAIISGLNTDQAKQKLLEYGIAVEDTSGKLRNFMDVFRDIASLRSAGLIDERGFKELASAIGGQGARRGAQVEAVLTNLQRAGDLAKVSASAQNDAYDALGIKLDTVQTKITELNNAFQKLSLTLGEDGGMLDTLKSILSVATSITSAFTGIVQTLGRAAPILATAGVTLAYAGRTGKLEGAGGGAASFLLQNSSIAQSIVRQKQIPGTGMVAPGITDAMSENFINKAKISAPTIGVLIAEGFVAASNLRERNFEGLFGQVLGGALGFVAGGPYGALIGATIGQSIADTLFRYKTQFADFFAQPTTPRGTGPGGQETDTERIQRQAQELALRGAGGKAQVKITQTLKNVTGALVGADPVTELQTAYVILKQISELKPNQVGITGRAYTKDEIEQAKKDIAELDKLLKQGREAQNPTGNEAQGVTTPFNEETKVEAEKNAKLMSDIMKKYEGDLRTSLNNQEVSIKEFKDQTDFFAAGGVSVIRVYTALKGSADSLAGDLTKISDILRDSNTEQRDYISQLTTQIADLENQIKDLQSISVNGDIGVAGGGNRGDLAALEARKKVLQDVSVEYLKGIDAANRFNNIKLTPIVSGEGFNMDEFIMTLEGARQEQEKYLQSIALQQGLNPDEIQKLKDSYEPWFLYLEGRYQEVTKLDPQFFEQVKKAYEDMGKISIKPPEPFGIQSIDQERGQFLAAYQKQRQFVTSNFPEYKLDEKRQGVIFKNNVTDVLHLDNLVTQLALQELIDVNKKQLDGIYNLPSGSSFYVPFQAAKLAPDKVGNASDKAEKGLGNVASSATTATASLYNLAAKINQITSGTYIPQKELGTTPKPVPTVEQAGRMTGTYLPQKELGPTPKPTDYSKMTGTYMPQAATPPTTPTSIEDLLRQALQSIQANPPTVAPPSPTLKVKPEDIMPPIYKEPSAPITQLPDTSMNAKPVSTRLTLDISSMVQVMLDGRVIADIVKPYLYEDMLRYEGTAGSIIKTVVI